MPKKNPCENVSISLESCTLELIDDYCQRHDINRSSFFKKASKFMMIQECNNLDFWVKLYQERIEAS